MGNLLTMRACMLRFFKARSHQSEVAPRAASPMPPSQVSAVGAETVAGKGQIDSLVSLATINGITAVQHGARVAVLGALMKSVLEHLPATTRTEIAASFRTHVEELLSLGDDMPLPEHFQATLLMEVNRYLDALR